MVFPTSAPHLILQRDISGAYVTLPCHPRVSVESLMPSSLPGVSGFRPRWRLRPYGDVEGAGVMIARSSVAFGLVCRYYGDTGSSGASVSSSCASRETL
jgi:hypothetical protein